MEDLETAKKYQRVLDLIDAHNIDREKVEEAFNDYANSLYFGEKERDALREENAALRAAVAEMGRMLPVLERLNESYPTLLSEACGSAVEVPSVFTYRQTLETALSFIKKQDKPASRLSKILSF